MTAWLTNRARTRHTAATWLLCLLLLAGCASTTPPAAAWEKPDARTCWIRADQHREHFGETGRYWDGLLGPVNAATTAVEEADAQKPSESTR